MSAADKAPDGFVLRGATGSNAHHINGTYEKVQDVVHNDRPLYRQLEKDNCWLRMCPDGDWAVSYTENKDHNNNVGWCYSANNGAAHPCAVTGWKVLDGGKMESQPSLVVERKEGQVWKELRRGIKLATMTGKALRAMLAEDPALIEVLQPSHLKKLKQSDLKAALEKEGLPSGGYKTARIQRLFAHFSNKSKTSAKRPRDAVESEPVAPVTKRAHKESEPVAPAFQESEPVVPVTERAHEETFSTDAEAAAHPV